MTDSTSGDRSKATALLRDPMSKTVIVALAGIVCITAICLATLASVMAGVAVDGATVTLIVSMGGNIMACVGVVGSRSQSPAATRTARGDSDA